MADITKGQLLEKVKEVPSILEAIIKTPQTEIYRAPMTEYELDPIYIMITPDNVLATFGETGLVSTIEKIDGPGERYPVVERDKHGQFHINTEYLPIDGVKRNRRYSDSQYIGLLLDYIYNQISKLPENGDKRIKIFRKLTADKVIARFRDYSSLISPQDIIPDYSDRTNIVTVSQGCANNCRYCPEGGSIELFSREKIEQNMKFARRIQQKYHKGLEEFMDEGFINTSCLLWFALLKESQISPQEILRLYLRFFPEEQKISTFMDVRNILAYSMDKKVNMPLALKLGKLAKAGLTRAYIGIETGDDITSAFLGKNISYEDKLFALSLLESAGIKVKAIVQVGTIGEGFYKKHSDIGQKRTASNFVSSRKSLEKTVELLLEAKPYRVMVSTFLPLRGLPILRDRRIVHYADSRGIQREIRYLVKHLGPTGIRVELEYDKFVEGRKRVKK